MTPVFQNELKGQKFTVATKKIRPKLLVKL
jgi:hypothetical protein